MPGENTAVLSDEEKKRILYHMGYMNLLVAPSIQLGVPAASQTSFLVHSAMERIPVAAIGTVRRIVAQLDNIETKLMEAPDFLVASDLGELSVRENYPELLEQEYVRWARRLSDTLGAPLNPYSNRFLGGKAPINLPVAH